MTSFMLGPRGLASSLSIVVVAGALVALPAASFSAPTQEPIKAEVEAIPIAGVSAEAKKTSPKPDPDAHDQHGESESQEGHDHGSSTQEADPLKPAVITDPIETQSSFGLVGVAFDAAPPADTAVQIRVKESAGWSDWEDLAVNFGHGPDQDTAEFDQVRHTTEPLLTGPSDAVQVRVDTPEGESLPTAEVQAVEATESEADADVATQGGPAAQANAATPQPAIISRAGWGADERLRNGCPGLTDAAKIGFVHHTASTSNYTELGAPSQLRSIYSWTTSNGYCDMPYNFFVDQYGNIYEGRGGGVHLAVRSGATASFNSGSFSVAALGNYSVAPGNGLNATKNAISKLAAWKLALTGRSALGTESLTAGGYPGGAARGTVQSFNRISGHRDAISTSCPGDALYPELASIRTQAANRQSGIGVSPAPAPDNPAIPVVAGRYASSVTDWSKKQRWRAKGKFYNSSFVVNPREAREAVIKRKRPGKSWKVDSNVTTDSNGSASFALKFRKGATQYRITVPKTAKAKFTRNSKITLTGRNPK